MRIINLGIAMKAVREIVRNTPGLSFCIQEQTEPLSFNWHFHEEYELTLVIEGPGTRFIGDDVATFDSGDLVLIGPGVPHAYESMDLSGAGRNRTIILQFPVSLFLSDRSGLAEFRNIHGLLRLAASALSFDRYSSTTVSPILDASTHHPELEKLVDLVRTLDLLARIGNPTAIATEWRRNEGPPSYPDQPGKDAKLLQFIVANAEGPLSLQMISDYAGMSVATVCRFFKKHYGSTFNEYLTRIRIAHACKLLIQSDLPIYSVCYESGFENLSNFNRRFLRVKGMTPSAYRRLHQVTPAHAPRRVAGTSHGVRIPATHV